MARVVEVALLSIADPIIAEHSQRFFKTGLGEYGEGDQFLGIRVPVLRQQAKCFQELSLGEIEMSLRSPWHEERLCALLILVLKYQAGDEQRQSSIFQLYLDNTRYINNWDLVDCSAHYIVGAHLLHRDRAILYQLATSDIPWERVPVTFGGLDFANIMDLFPEVQFYDYTKITKRAIAFGQGNMPHNYHLTFSLNEDNDGAAREVLHHGGNVAVVFFTVPEVYMNAEVIDGDETDVRFRDRPFVVVGLKAKGKARKDTSGFVR